MNFTAMIQGVSRLKEAMECGKEVADPAGWKNKSVLANKLTIVLSFIVLVLKITGVNLPISDADLEVLAVSLAGLLSFIHIIVTLVTSKKVGTGSNVC